VDLDAFRRTKSRAFVVSTHVLGCYSDITIKRSQKFLQKRNIDSTMAQLSYIIKSKCGGLTEGGSAFWVVCTLIYIG